MRREPLHRAEGRDKFPAFRLFAIPLGGFVTYRESARTGVTMGIGSLRREGACGDCASYHASRLPGLHCSTLLDEGPPRAFVHDRFALVTLTAGEALVWCRGQTQVVTPGSVLMIEPGDVHRSLRKTRYGAVTVTLRADLVKALRGAERGARFASNVAHCARLSAATLALADAVRAGRDLALQERLTASVFALLEPFWTDEPPRTEPPLVLRARRALAESPSPSPSLAELARRLRCAPTYLCRVFSEHAGIGPHAYHLQQRLLEAARLLESGHTVARTASLTGFSSASHLRRHFQRRFATAPGRYQHELSPIQ